MLALRSSDWVERARARGEAGVVGVVRPGVDGDVAGIWIPEPTRREALVRTLEGRATAAGLRWSTVDEDELRRQLAASS